MLTRLTVARLAATHAIEIHCTHDDCAAVVVGPLPEEWLADPDTGDVLCPQCRAEAVWFGERTAAVDPVACLRLAAECTEDDARMSPAPWTVESDVLYSDSKEDGTIPLAEFCGEAMIEDDAAVARVRNSLPAIIAQLRAAAGVNSLDGIDQGSSVPTAVLRETSDPQRPGLIGDETLPMRPRGRR